MLVTHQALRGADTSQANYTASVDITNTGVDRSEYAAAADISGAALIDAAIIESDALNTVVQKGGQEIPAEPPNNRIAVEVLVVCTTGGSVCTEYTTEAVSADLNDVPLLTTSPTTGDAVYFGFHNPARILTLDVGQTSGHNLDLTWQYLGVSSWTNLTGVDDRSNDFSRFGRRTVSWDMPTSEWPDQTVNGSSRVSRWARALVGNVQSSGQQPLADRAFYENGQWWVWDDSLAAGEQEQYTLYLGGPDMVTRHQVFPGAVGITTPDSSVIEPGNIYSIEVVGRFTQSSTGSGVCIVCKGGALTLTVTGSGTALTFSVTGASTTRFDISNLTLPATGSQTVTIDSDGTDVTVLVTGLSGNVSRSGSGTAQSVTDNSSLWQWVTNSAMRYIDRIRIFGESLLEVTNYDSEADWDVGTFDNTSSEPATPPTHPNLSLMVEQSTSDGSWIEGTSEFFNNFAGDTLLGFDNSGGRTSHNGFFRFSNVQIAPGSTIATAVLEFVPRETNSNTTVNLRIRAVAEDNASAPSSFADAEGRTRTSAQVDWDNVPTWTVDTAIQSPDITSVVQEIVDRAGWISGNALVIYAEDNGSTAAANTLRRPRAFDDPNSAVRLLITLSGQALAGNDFIQLSRLGLTNSVTDNPTDWVKQAGAASGEFRVASSFIQFGDYSHSFSQNTNGTEAYVRQTLSATGSEVWSAGMWITERSTAFGHNDFIRLRWLDSAGGEISNVQSNVPLDASPEYEFFSFNAQTAPAGTANVQVEVGQSCSAGCTNNPIRADEVIACVCNPVPTSPDAANRLSNPGFEEVYQQSGTWTSNTITFTTTDVGSATVDWDENTSSTRTVAASTSLNSGTFQSVTNGGAIPGINVGDNLSSSNLRLRLTLAGTGADAGTFSPFVGEATVTIRGAGTNPDLWYELNTTPGVTIEDRSVNSNDGTMSYPQPLENVLVTLGPLTPTRTIISTETAIGIPEIASAVTASAVATPLSSTDPGSDLLFGDMIALLSTLWDWPIQMLWGIAFLLLGIFVGAWVTRATDSLMFGATMMLGVFALGIVIGTGLIQPWIILLAIPIAIVIVWLRRIGLPT